MRNLVTSLKSHAQVTSNQRKVDQNHGAKLVHIDSNEGLNSTEERKKGEVRTEEAQSVQKLIYKYRKSIVTFTIATSNVPIKYWCILKSLLQQEVIEKVTILFVVGFIME